MPDFFNSLKCSTNSDALIIKFLLVMIGMYLILTHVSKYVFIVNIYDTDVANTVRRTNTGAYHETSSSRAPSNFAIASITTNTKTSITSEKEVRATAI